MPDIQFICNFIHKDIAIVDRRFIHLDKPRIRSYLHEIHYYTALPKIFEIGDYQDTNAYHIFIYMLIRLYYIDNGTADVVFYYPPSSYLIEATLAALPPRFKRKYIKLDCFEYIELPGCRCTTIAVEEPWAYQYIRDLYKHIWEPVPVEKGKRVYISRKGASTRHILNEEEMIEPLKNIGFSIYHLEDMTVQDQIRLAASAEIITGPHGAGLTWTIFAKKETVLCEIIHESGKLHFYDIAHKLNMPYYTFLVHYADSKQNYTINITNYINALVHILRTHSLLS